MNPLSILLSTQFIILSLGVSFLIFIIRKILEYAYPKLINNKLYSDVVLPIFPILLGLMLGFIPFSTDLLLFRLLEGGVAGMLSSHLYRSINALLSISQNQQSTQVIAQAPMQIPQEMSQAKPIITGPSDGYK